MDGRSGIAIGNIIGSNVATIGFVLGLTVAPRPVLVNRKKYFASWLIVLISTLMFYGFSLDGQIGKMEGFFFVAGLLAFISISISYMRNEDEDEDYNVSLNPLLIFVFFILGTFGLYFGSELLIVNASNIALKMGVSEFIIGVTIVALGTSLPELVTSLIASFRGQNSISIGNLLGSNVFNIFAVLGITSIVKPIPVDLFLVYIDIPVLLGFVFVLFLFMFLGKRMGLIEGLALLVAYITYITYSFL